MKLALELGASDDINTSDPHLDLILELRKRTKGLWPPITIDATGNSELITLVFEFTGRRGRMVLGGTPAVDVQMDVNLYSALMVSSYNQVLF